jgi:hypothetical protein
VLFALGEPNELLSICSGLVRVFTEAGMHENARTSLAYLDAAARAGTLTEPLIVRVQTYIERKDYGQPFAPLA